MKSLLYKCEVHLENTFSYIPSMFSIPSHFSQQSHWHNPSSHLGDSASSSSPGLRIISLQHCSHTFFSPGHPSSPLVTLSWCVSVCWGQRFTQSVLRSLSNSTHHHCYRSTAPGPLKKKQMENQAVAASLSAIRKGSLWGLTWTYAALPWLWLWLHLS